LTGTQNSEPVRRPREIEELTNYFVIHPLAGRLTPLFAALHIPPNAVSLAGMSFGVLAAVAYYHYQDIRYAVAGFILMIAWHVMDGADGQLARLTHSQSQTGKILDGVCDYVTFIAVYVALAAALSRTMGEWVWGLVAASGVCHAFQSAAYEVQREEYACFVWGRQSAQPLGPDRLPQRGSSSPPASGLFQVLYRLYVQVQFQVAGVSVEFHKRLTMLLQRKPERAASVRQRYRETFAPAVRRWSVLSSNYRTLGIFISALLGAPQYYFEFEILGFSAILALLKFGQRARYAQFFRSLEPMA
jgi:phosphatidylglycerophosphate synthase